MESVVLFKGGFITDDGLVSYVRQRRSRMKEEVRDKEYKKIMLKFGIAILTRKFVCPIRVTGGLRQIRVRASSILVSTALRFP